MIKQLHRNTSPTKITSLSDNEIFVYGANRSWFHGLGAAKTALQWGAVHTKGPFSGQTYGICTKDEYIDVLPLEEIEIEIKKFIDFANEHPELRFLVTAIGTGLAFYDTKDIAPLFFKYIVPTNVYMPESFWKVYETLS